MAAATGLPQVSSRRYREEIFQTQSVPCFSVRCCANTVATSLRSAPAWKALPPEVSTAPLMAGSVTIRSTTAARSAENSGVITFIGRPGTFMVTSATPSWSTCVVMVVAMSHPFDDGGGAHAGADAERYQGALQVAALQLVERDAEDDRPGGA